MGHTKGEWKQVDDGLCIVLPDKRYVSVMLGGFTKDEARANARLIASAPDLLRLCKIAAEYASRAGEESLLSMLNEGINKAERGE